MANKISPCLWFNNDAEAAAKFYVSLFKGKMGKKAYYSKVNLNPSHLPKGSLMSISFKILGQEFLGQCGAVLFLTMILQRMRPKYQDRSYRYGLLEAGHIGENAYLAATSAGLGACGIGAFMDDQINAMLGVDGVEEAVVYMLAVGRRA